MMKMIFYADKKQGFGKQLWEYNSRLGPKDQGTFYATFSDLKESLTRPGNDLDIVVLLANDHEDLLNLIAIKKLLLDYRTILILPDSEKVTISLGHKLYPRFLSYANSRINDVALVLDKMIADIHPTASFQKPMGGEQHEN